MTDIEPCAVMADGHQASAYDTDDSVATMVQMVGVIVLALGLPRVVHSIDEGNTIDNSVAVAGYVVMRVAMIFLWLHAARQDQLRRRACQMKLIGGSAVGPRRHRARRPARRI